MTAVVVAVLVTGLLFGYHWHRDHLRLVHERDVARSMVQHPSRRHLRSVDR